MAPTTTKVFIGNLTDDCDSKGLRDLLETVGPIAEMDVIRNYGFVHFKDAEHAQRAVDKFNQTEYEGKTLKVELSRTSGRPRPAVGSMTECFCCGKLGHWSKDCRFRGRGRGRGGPYREPYHDPHADPYYSRRYLPPPPAYDRHSPYGDPYEHRRLAMARDPYLMERERDYYELAARDAAYYDYYARRRAYADGPDRPPFARPGAYDGEPGRPYPRDAYAPHPRSGPPVARSRVPGPY